MPTIVLTTDKAKAKHVINSTGLAYLEEAVANAIAEERERCAQIVENALREDFKARTGKERGLSEAEAFFAKRIRSGHA